MSQLGSLEWSRRNGGRLSAAERFGIALSGVSLQLRRRFAAARSDGGAALSLEALTFPDSAAVKQTLALCEDAYEPYLLNHCARTYLWAGLVGQRERLRFDTEELLIAALLHDIGLTVRAKAKIDCECFAVRGARFAQAYLGEAGHTALAAAVPGSICLHLNLAVSNEKPLDYLLHQGAAIDVIGWDLYKVGVLKAEVLSRYPRHEFKARICDSLKAEAREHPRARAALMMRLGFLQLIRSAAYAE